MIVPTSPTSIQAGWQPLKEPTPSRSSAFVEASVKEERMNKEWHQHHRLATKASRSERIAWHAAHEDVCDCRPAPEDLAAEIAAYRDKNH